MSPQQAARLKASLADKARALGFDDMRVALADAPPRTSEHLAGFIAAGHHGSMEWMAETAERRAAPQALWPDARRVISLALSYAPDGDPLASLSAREQATISVYARNRDYHDIIKGRLKELAQHLLAQARRMGLGEGEVKVFVDTAPVMEKPLAQQAGLGWQGKHTNLVSRRLGSWFFLAEIFTDLELPVDEAEVDHCGSCRACLEVCPTDAFPAPYRLDARRCISYLTIENKGPIPRAFRAAMGNRIYGCDDCLAACPWNKFAVEAHEARLVARDELRAPALADLLQLDDAAFRTLFSGSPIKRIGRDRFLRNVLVAAGNSGSPSLAARVEPLLADDSPLVRGAAVWAASRLLPQARFAALASAALAGEQDEEVRGEWQAALAADDDGPARPD
ncbi:tRNA epoxyqueuosine(34) reductase QueG [Stappia indica]|uniref:Epoxyqueuosine reductase n=1 Tax=Stappia indica TaxID=538381 RepID=A0A857CEL3_9HYPH|nr:tRNA epoxyqueuosine(34) reductase QueG [Stappia indica]QGZ37454.1 tRNA epoxyqueuosine(34) reductase QueG [Stappia indica]